MGLGSVGLGGSAGLLVCTQEKVSLEHPAYGVEVLAAADEGNGAGLSCLGICGMGPGVVLNTG